VRCRKYFVRIADILTRDTLGGRVVGIDKVQALTVTGGSNIFIVYNSLYFYESPRFEDYSVQCSAAESRRMVRSFAQVYNRSFLFGGAVRA